MTPRSTLVRVAAALVVVAVPASVFTAGGSAKGTPSNVTVACGPGVTRATVTVQLVSGAANPTPASNQIVLGCSGSDKLAPLTQPAAAYTWSAFVTTIGSTFGCGGTEARGKTATCTNAAGGAGQVTVVAS